MRATIPIGVHTTCAVNPRRIGTQGVYIPNSVTVPAGSQIPFPELANRFELVEAFHGGEGWSGSVRQTDGEVAVLKVLLPGGEHAEASLLASLDHPRIPQILEIGELEDGRAFLLRQFLPGSPLSVDTTMAPSAATELAVQLLEVLAYVHLRGICHFDIKPANVLRHAHDGGIVYALLDFGLSARSADQSRGGTPFFAAPERILGLQADVRSDLFSLGVLLYAVLRPKDQALPLRAHAVRFPRTDFLTSVGARFTHLPIDLQRFLTRLLAHSPEDRFPDAEEALESLAGRSGRPSLSTLRPDPIAIHGDAIATCARSLGPAEDLRIAGADSSVRSGLALHAATFLPNTGTFTVEVESGYVRICRGGAGTRSFAIPQLDADALGRHLGSCLRLPADVAAATAAHLLREGRSGIESVELCLRSLVEAGKIVPEGTRWIWPDAISGRNTTRAAAPKPANPADLRREAARGHVEQALSAYRTSIGSLSPDEDRRWRAALTEGLLLCGEPARCLPFVADLPAHHARVLLDLGQSAAAAAMVSSFADRSPDELLIEERDRQRLIATIDHVCGNEAAALVRLEPIADRDPERIILSQVLLGLDRAGEALELLNPVVRDLSPVDQPFLLAAALTSLAACQRHLGDLPAAAASYRRAQSGFFDLGHVRHSATAAGNLGVIAKDLGQYSEAMDYQRRARAMYEHVGDRRGGALVQANHGILNLAMGDPGTALPHLRDAIAEFESLGAHQHDELLLVRMAEAHAALGESTEARRCLAQSGPPTSGPLANLAARVAASLDQTSALHSTKPDPSEENTVMALQPPNTGVPKEVFRTFLAVNRRLAGEADLDRAMTYLLDAAVTLTGGRTGYLLVLRDDGLRQEFRCGETNDSVVAFSRSMVNRAIQQRRTQTAEDALADRELVEMASVQNLRKRSVICSPFHSSGGRKGALYVEHPSASAAFGESEREHLEILADQAAIAVDRMAHEDSLTAELEQSQRDLIVARRTTPSARVTMLGQSPPMKALRKEIQRVATSELAVLIRGATGSGKELVARALHQQSGRNRGAFVAENCSAIPENLIESEFFGHVKGAFTGADDDRAGLLEMASGGTLFLDEIGDMPMSLQVKLLRAIQESAVRRVGATQLIRIDVRLVSATHKNLREMIAKDEFREDLYFRIAAVEVLVPALRDRGTDILLLADSFLDALNVQHRRQVALSDSARADLLAYGWPGNVRELHHVISRAFILAEGARIDDLQLPTDRVDAGGDEWPAISLREAESRTIRAALRSTGGDKTKAARLLGISRTAIYEKLRRMRDADNS